jgi:hypothetical protein
MINGNIICKEYFIDFSTFILMMRYFITKFKLSVSNYKI